jgi:hypothetical protein
MQPLQDVLTESNGPRVAESDFFRRPPLRSYQFIVATMVMLMALACGSLILGRHWNELSTSGIMQLGFATAAVVLLWVRIYQIFQRLHELYCQASLEPSFARSPIDKVLRSAGDLMYAVLFYAFAGAAYFYFALDSALSHHHAF